MLLKYILLSNKVLWWKYIYYVSHGFYRQNILLNKGHWCYLLVFLMDDSRSPKLLLNINQIVFLDKPLAISGQNHVC